MTPVSSLFELNLFIRRVMALNFKEFIWIRAEVLQAKFSKEHCYIDLIEKDADKDQVIAQSNAVIWRSTLSKLMQVHKQVLPELLQPGLELKLLVKVEYDERYGLKLNIQDIDPNYTIGKLAILRRQTLETLQRERLLDLNQRLLLPDVVQRIAVISSENAAGWHDFKAHLSNNPYGYTYHISFFPAAVQGQDAEKEIVGRIKEVRVQVANFDAVIIIRGGGSKLDLNAFDGLDIARAIATSTIPVLTGIGHEIDESVADLVSWRAFKTPTAVADFLLHQHLVFENKVLEALGSIQSFLQAQVRQTEKILFQISNGIKDTLLQKITKANNQLSIQSVKLQYATQQKVTQSQHDLKLLSASLDNLNPENIMQRGYSLVLKGDSIIKSGMEIDQDDELEIRFLKDGVKVKKI